MASSSELLQAFKDLSGDYKQKNKDTSLIKLLDRTISTMTTIMESMDKFLKTKGVDVGDLYKKSLASSKSALDSLSKDAEGNKVGLIKGIAKRGADSVAKLKEKFRKSADNSAGAPPPETTGETYEHDKEDSKGIAASLIEKLSGAAALFSSKDENGEAKPNWFQKRKEQEEKRKAEVAAEKEDAKNRLKKTGKNSNWLMKILGGIKFAALGLGRGLGKVAGFLGGTFFSAFKWGVPKLIGGFGKVLGVGLGKLVPALATTIAKLTSGAVGGILKGAARLALPVAAAAGKAIVGVAGAALSAAAVPLLVGAAVVGAGYGAYKLYKYLTRNSIDEDIFGKIMLLRFQTYGYSSANKDDYHKLIELEQLMKNYLHFNPQEKKLNILPPNEEDTRKLFELFDAPPDNKDRQKLVGTWFSKRFVPAYHAFMSAMLAVNSTLSIEDVDNLTPPNINELMTLYKIPVKAMEYVGIPFFAKPESSVTIEDVENSIAVIIAENKKKLTKEQLTPEERMSQEVARIKNKEYTDKIIKGSGSDLDSMMKKYTGKGLPGSHVNTNNGTVGIMTMTPENMAKPNYTPMMMKNLQGNVSQDGETEIKTPGSLLLAPRATGTVAVNNAGGAVLKDDGSLAGITLRTKEQAFLNLDPDVRNMFAGMAREYNTLTGKNISFNSGWRDMAEQAKLYAQHGPGGKAAKPGSSLHEYGLAIDINSADTEELEKLGLLRKYGFTVPVGGEKWHIEPIGVSLNPSKAKTDKAFRSDAIKTSLGRGGGGLGLDPKSKKYNRDFALQNRIYNSEVKENKVEPPELVGVANMPAANPAIAGTQAQPDSNPMSFLMSSSVRNNTSISTIPPGGNDAETKPRESTGANPTSTVASTGGGFSPERLMNPGTYSSMQDSTSNKVSGGMSVTNTASPNLSQGIDSFAGMSAVDALKQAATMTGVPYDLLLTYAKLESSLRTGVSSTSSSATGLLQMTDAAWEHMVKDNGAKYGIKYSTPRSNPLANALMAAEYVKFNLGFIRGYEKLGIPQDVALYLTHHYGPGGGRSLIQAALRNPHAPMQSVVSGKVYEANISALGGRTIGQYLSELSTKFHVAKNTDASEYKGSGAKKGQMVASNSAPSPAPNTSMPSVASIQSSLATNNAPPPVSAPSNPYDSYGQMAKASLTSPVAPSVSSPVNTSGYDVVSRNTPQPQKVKLDSDSMESILTSQLDVLKQLATIMGSIDTKFDMEKLGEVISTKSVPNQSSNAGLLQANTNTRGGRHTGVSLERKMKT